MVGFYITKKGKYRRMDVIMPTYDEMPFCLISWTGERFLWCLQEDCKTCVLYKVKSLSFLGSWLSFVADCLP